MQSISLTILVTLLSILSLLINLFLSLSLPFSHSFSLSSSFFLLLSSFLSFFFYLSSFSLFNQSFSWDPITVREGEFSESHIDTDNGVTPVASYQFSAQAASFRQHKHLGQRIETFGEVGDGIPIQHSPRWLWNTLKKHIGRLRELNLGPSECELPRSRFATSLCEG